MTTEQASNKALLVLPRLRVQNANTISSPMTWGFPAITAFTGLMTALERRLGPNSSISFYGVGVVCHGFEPQVTHNGYTCSFHLTRNPVWHDGSTAAIVEEGRAHLNITLVFDVELTSDLLGEAERAQLAMHISEVMASMRVAGGSVVPPLPGAFHNQPRPLLILISDDPKARRNDFRKLKRRWLPGFVLVSRDDLLQARLDELKVVTPSATLLDAWLDLSRLNHRVVRKPYVDDKTGVTTEVITWETDHRLGWLVPMPVGFVALSDLYQPSTVVNARDTKLPFRWVESIYSMGQWISPHRLTDVNDLLWMPYHETGSNLYRCVNAYKALAFSSFPQN